ncbi:speckle targeted PIP5K1A-regulated poly(A) polymerase-like [Centruroides sculpturatus]|uniref:speckle targeted PIP5K1A-regulated poly(A) polymerase-like n=1 Tax=Centruroides sculpturatus TaxID=218467 RepID=UPI000C6EC4AA|nr:speckle targeted PIP5K1A-regulated poly(A) polymerase-like [Centruroides sculpturatus]
MGNRYCDICGISLTKGNMKSHLQGKKHLNRLQRRTVHERDEQTAKKSIFVTNLPLRADENNIKQKFESCGTVVKVTHNSIKHFAFVDFSNESSAEVALSRPQWMFGQRLIVKKRTVKKPDRPRSICMAVINRQVDHSDLIGKLSKCESVWEQTIVLQSEVSLNNDSLKLRKTIVNMLQNILSNFFPGSGVYMFGSSVNGFGFQGCDLDLHLKLPESYFMDGIDLKDCAPKIEDVLSQKAILENLTHSAKAVFVHKVLRKYTKGIENILFIPSYRCPLVRFQLNVSNNLVNCDLTVGKGITIENSMLLYTYGQLDPDRIRPFIITLRYWGKYHELIGSGDKLTSYSFVLLCIFYLQTRKPPVVPTVLKLKELAENECIIGKWDCSFCRDVSKIPKSENKQSIRELLEGFFKFYAQFDFTLNVICPRTGNVVGKNEFMSDPEENFKVSPISIQDPFDLSHNTGSSINEKFLEEFKGKLQTSVNIINSRYKMWNLVDLLNPIVNFENQSWYSPNENISVKVKFTNDMLKCVVKNSSSVAKDIKSLWLMLICSTIIDIFRIALCADCQVIKNVFDKTKVSRKRRLDDSSRQSNDDICLSKQKLMDPKTYVNPIVSTTFECNFNSESDDNKPTNFNIPSCSVDDNCTSNMEIVSSEAKEDMEVCDSINTLKDSSQKGNDIILHLSCRVKDQIWQNRKKETKDHCSQETDILKIEKEISQKIIACLGKDIKYLVFDCIVKKQYIGGTDSVYIEFLSQNFDTLNKINSFIKPYVSKLLVKHMTRS